MLSIKGKNASIENLSFPCVIGRDGFTPHKQEGDGKTPVGLFPLRCVYYRPDRVEKPETKLPVYALTKECGFCDDPLSPYYNHYVRLPFQESHEQLWRTDSAYDLICVVGYNDAPAVPYKGSAIFLHLIDAHENGTAGCIAFHIQDFVQILRRLDTKTYVDIKAE